MDRHLEAAVLEAKAIHVRDQPVTSTSATGRFPFLRPQNPVAVAEAWTDSLQLPHQDARKSSKSARNQSIGGSFGLM